MQLHFLSKTSLHRIFDEQVIYVKLLELQTRLQDNGILGEQFCWL